MMFLPVRSFYRSKVLDGSPNLLKGVLGIVRINASFELYETYEAPSAALSNENTIAPLACGNEPTIIE